MASREVQKSPMHAEAKREKRSSTCQRVNSPTVSGRVGAGGPDFALLSSASIQSHHLHHHQSQKSQNNSNNSNNNNNNSQHNHNYEMSGERERDYYPSKYDVIIGNRPPATSPPPSLSSPPHLHCSSKKSVLEQLQQQLQQQQHDQQQYQQHQHQLTGRQSPISNSSSHCSSPPAPAQSLNTSSSKIGNRDEVDSIISALNRNTSANASIIVTDRYQSSPPPPSSPPQPPPPPSPHFRHHHQHHQQQHQTSPSKNSIVTQSIPYDSSAIRPSPSPKHMIDGGSRTPAITAATSVMIKSLCNATNGWPNNINNNKSYNNNFNITSTTTTTTTMCSINANTTTTTTTAGTRTAVNNAHSFPLPSTSSTSPMPIGNEPLAQLLITLKEQNKSLIREIEDLRIKLEDAEGDLKLVRCQMRSMSKQMDSVVIETNRDRIVDETILGELEYFKQKVLLLERDIQSLLDEKEELIITRDDLTLKNERLNEHLLSLMRSISSSGNAATGSVAGNETNSTLPYDVDALYLENRYLKEKIKNEEEERRLLIDRLGKYKELIEQRSELNEQQQQQQQQQRKKKNNFIGGSSSSGVGVGGVGSSDSVGDPATLATIQLPGGRVVSAREIERLINSESIHSMDVSKTNQLYLWNLLVALFEGMQSKNMNLVHARKTNRLLGKRVEELESHLLLNLESRERELRNSHRHSHRLSDRKSPNASGEIGTTAASGAESSISARSTPSTITSSVIDRHLDRNLIDDDDLLTPIDGTDGNISTSITKETSEDDDGEEVDGDDEDDEPNDELSSTPSTVTRHSATTIEQHLKALQDDALSDQPLSTTSTKSKLDSSFDSLQQLRQPPPHHHHHHHHRSSSGSSPNHHYSNQHSHSQPHSHHHHRHHHLSYREFDSRTSSSPPAPSLFN